MTITDILNKIDDIMYAPILIIIMAAAGLYFTFRTNFVQIRLFKHACGLVMEPPKNEDGKSVSSLSPPLPESALATLSASRPRSALAEPARYSGCG